MTHAAGRDRVVAVGLVMLCHGLQNLSLGGIALFLPLIRSDLAMSFAQAGLLSAAATLTYAMMQIPAGYLADRFGPGRVVLVGLCGTTVTSALFGLVGTYGHAVATQTVSGFFRALVFAPGITLIASWFAPHRRATAMGLTVAGSFSGTIVVSLVGPLVAREFGWRVPFVAIAAAGLVTAVSFLRYGRDNPDRPARQRVGLFDAFALVRYRIIWVCGAIQFIRLGVVMGIGFWLPSLLMEDRGLSLAAAGGVAAIAAAFTASSNSLGGYISDRLQNPPLVIGLSFVVLAITSALLVTIDDARWLLVVVAVNAVFLQFYFGPLFAVPLEVLGPRTAGTSTGLSNFFANLGSLAFAYALGVVKDAQGSFTLGFLGIATACVVGLVLTSVLARMRNQALHARRLGGAG